MPSGDDRYDGYWFGSAGEEVGRLKAKIVRLEEALNAAHSLIDKFQSMGKGCDCWWCKFEKK